MSEVTVEPGKMVGGPGDAASPIPAPAVSADPIVETKSTAIYLGSKKFNNMDELVRYTSQAEADRQGAMDELNRIKASIAPPASSEPDIEEEFWTSPKKALEKVRQSAKEDAKREVLQEIASQKSAQETRDTFYGKNSDLKGHEDLVELYAVRMQKELASVHPDEQLSKIAQAVRAKVASIRGTQVATEELPSGPAVTVGATSGQPTRVSANNTPSFVDQLQALRSKGKTKR